MTQKQIKDKLSSINTLGALMMLFDFLSETDHFGKLLKDCIDTEEIAKQVVSIAAKLKVKYRSEITPVEKSEQRDLESLITEIRGEKGEGIRKLIKDDEKKGKKLPGKNKSNKMGRKNIQRVELG